MSGKVYLVGAGCGHWELITLRGKRLLEQCDTVIYDSLIDGRLLGFASENAEKICVGKRAGHHSETQEKINNLLVEKACEGKRVVRLKGGDPFVFGRGGEEALTLLEHNIDFSVVPGISSAIAVPELAGIPVTHRGISRSVHIIAGYTADGRLDLSQYAKLEGTLVFLMGLGRLGQIAEDLINNGRAADTPAAVISNGGGTRQSVVRSTLRNIAQDAEKTVSPAMIVVGEVADFDFSSAIKKPLQGVSVTVTGTKGFAGKLSAVLEDLDAGVNKLDFLDVKEWDDNAELDSAMKGLHDFSWLVFTSVNGVRIFFKRLSRLEIDIRKLAIVKFAAIGSGTAEEIKKHGIYCDLLPDSFTTKALGKALAGTVSENDRVLILRAEQGSEELTEALDLRGISYTDIKIYSIEGNGKISAGYEICSDYLTFASSSGVKFFFNHGYTVSKNTKIVCIGKITANELNKHGVKDYLLSKVNTCEGIADVILREEEHAKIQTT